MFLLGDECNIKNYTTIFPFIFFYGGIASLDELLPIAHIADPYGNLKKPCKEEHADCSGCHRYYN